MNSWLGIAIGLVLTFGTGLFVASEFALVNVDRRDLERRRDEGEARLDLPILALRHTSTHLSSAQLGITLTTLLSGYTFEPAISQLIRPLLSAFGLGTGVVSVIGSILALLVATLLSMVFGELVPKTLAISDPLATARRVAAPQLVFTAVFRPAVTALNGTSNWVLHRVGIEPKEELSGARSAEELTSLVRRSALEGALDKNTARLLTKTLRFVDHTAADIMTPRPDIDALERTQTAADVVALAASTGHSRFPVIDDDMDDVVGIVHLKQAVSVPRAKRGAVPVSALMDDVLRAPETMTLDTLLAMLRGQSMQIALIVDEYGGTSGVATLEDIVEELIGEVSDEHDLARAGVVLVPDGGAVLPGVMRPDEVQERTSIVIPDDGPYETIGGFMMMQLQRIPTTSDTVTIPAGTLVVERMDGRRIDRVRFIPATKSPNDGDQDDA